MIEVRYCPNWLGDDEEVSDYSFAHLEIDANCQPLPITETATSHFDRADNTTRWAALSHWCGRGSMKLPIR